VSPGFTAKPPRPLLPWLVPVLDLLFPAVCPVCLARSDHREQRPFCAGCWAALPLVADPGCPVCGRPFAGLPPDLPCERCRRAPPPFACARAVALYRDGMREAIHALKYRRRPAVAAPLGRLVADCGPRLLAPLTPATVAFDAIVPVPLHPARLAERGFNQAELLAAPCAAAWGRPLLRGVLVRTRPTRPQTDLGAEARQANVAGAFAVRRPAAVAGRRLLLIDDVLTTGATVAAASAALREAGAARVGVLVLARAAET
jgi:ComF family protein